jgi:hypothetical protein
VRPLLEIENDACESGNLSLFPVKVEVAAHAEVKVQPRRAGVSEEVLAVAADADKFVPDDGATQHRFAYAEDARVEHANCGDAMVQRVRREVTAVQLDFRQLGHAKGSVRCRKLRVEVTMARVPDAEVSQLDRSIRAVLEAQAKRWGAPLLNHLIYARRPSIFKGARMMWSGLDASGLIDGRLVALINRRVALLNGCEF